MVTFLNIPSEHVINYSLIESSIRSEKFRNQSAEWPARSEHSLTAYKEEGRITVILWGGKLNGSIVAPEELFFWKFSGDSFLDEYHFFPNLTRSKQVPEARHAHAAAMLEKNNAAYLAIFGGIGQEDFSQTPLDDLWIYSICEFHCS